MTYEPMSETTEELPPVAVDGNAKDNIISQRRIGKFRIAESLIVHGDIDTVLQIVAECFAIRTEFRYDTMAFHYVAYHRDFDPVPLGVAAPNYEAVMERDSETGMTKFVGFKKVP